MDFPTEFAGASSSVERKPRSKFETVGNPQTMNLNALLYQNIINSPYLKNLAEMHTFEEVVDEIYTYVESLEPFMKGTSASTAFCLLYKLWTLKLSGRHVNTLITHVDSPYIRAIGFLYLRYVCKPADLWSWMEPYIDDDEEVQVQSKPVKRVITIGTMIRQLLTDQKWVGTQLPRIPVPVAKDIAQKLKENPPKFGGGEEEEYYDQSYSEVPAGPRKGDDDRDNRREAKRVSDRYDDRSYDNRRDRSRSPRGYSDRSRHYDRDRRDRSRSRDRYRRSDYDGRRDRGAYDNRYDDRGGSRPNGGREYY